MGRENAERDRESMFRRCFTLFLALVSLLGVLGCPVAAQEDGEKTAPGQVLEQLCTGFPYPGYERFKEVPQYFQQDYRDVPYGGPVGNVATHGCGITALAMLASYMCDEDLTPAVLAPMFLRYSSNEGTAFNLMDESAIPLGYHLEKRSSSLKEVIAALEKGQMVISLQNTTSTSRHLRVLPPSTPYFALGLGELRVAVACPSSKLYLALPEVTSPWGSGWLLSLHPSCSKAASPLPPSRAPPPPA